MGEVLYSAMEFFNLPSEEKLKFMSSDVYKPARYGTRLRDGADKIQFWRVFLKHYASPLEDKNPPKHRCAQVPGRRWGKNMDEGMQVMAVNCYPPCPQPDIAFGLPPHSDYSCLTIVLQSSEGLEFLGKEDESWRKVPNVHVGDHLEVLSNGIYKSVVHRATLNRERIRISITSLHSLGVGVKMETAKELQHPKGYKETSFMDFLNFLSKNDIAEGKNFTNTLKIVK
ncbi:hypothetical protein CUMW_165770 [Citrus unshiu]|uniref:Fe2OG dioxygenase domain-containing protein n=1 Tax=Citrus unshiu TaxID=55188 RepID=A0A2H5PTH0_CITUN|nr:hypothetical protein CUMW_165770 [Citrus unshiu]